jgi:hypothetical protein
MIFPDQPPPPQEHWLRFTAPGPAEGEGAAGEDVVVVSGYKSYSDSLITGSEKSDSTALSHEAHIHVGPRWRTVNGVSPIATVSTFSHYNSDTANDSGYGADACKWLFEFEPTQNPADGARILLKVFVHARGGPDFSIRGLAYHLVVRGVLAKGQNQETEFAEHKQLK